MKMVDSVADLQSWRPTRTYACIVEAHESTRRRLERTVSKEYEDHIAGKGFNSLSHYDLAHKLIPMPQAMEVSGAKAAVGQELEKFEKWAALQMTIVKSKREVILEAQRENK